jgi:hypothetical protein
LVGSVAGKIADAATAIASLKVPALAMRKLKLLDKLTPIAAAEAVSAAKAGRGPLLPRGE